MALIFSLVLFLLLWTVKSWSIKLWPSSLIKLNILLFFIFSFLLLALFKPFFTDFLNLPLDVRLNFQNSFKIAYSTLGESFKNIFLGSGSNTYLFDFLKYKPVILNSTSFWNVDFDRAFSFWLTILPSLGILFCLSLFFVFVFATVVIIKKFLRSKILEINDDMFFGIIFGLISVWFYLLVLSFIYPLNFILVIFMFIIFGLVVVASSFILSLGGKEERDDFIKALQFSPKNYKDFSIVDSPQKLFAFSLLLTGLLVASFFGLFFIGKRYVAIILADKALISYNQNGNTEKAMEKIYKAFNLYPNENFARIATQLWFDNLNQLLAYQNSQPQPSEVSKSQIQQVFNSAVSSLSSAISLNPANYRNWVLAGDFYESLISVSQGADSQAISFYQRAKELNPYNPVLSLAIGKGVFFE